jgi:hypothetical protein
MEGGAPPSDESIMHKTTHRDRTFSVDDQRGIYDFLVESEIEEGQRSCTLSSGNFGPSFFTR